MVVPSKQVGKRNNDSLFFFFKKTGKGDIFRRAIYALLRQLIFLIKNTTTPKVQALANTPYSGIGLKNLKRRLELLYAHQHELQITSGVDAFEAKLVVSLDKE